MSPRLIVAIALAIFLASVAVYSIGVARGDRAPDQVWGERGVRDGDLARPRAAVIDGSDRLYIVDFTARIQGYDLDGKHLGHTWTRPTSATADPAVSAWTATAASSSATPTTTASASTHPTGKN